PCQAVLGFRAVPTRCKYVPVSSRFSSLKTDGRHNPAPQPANKLRAAGSKPSAPRSFRRCVGTPLIRPFDDMDVINELTRTYLQRVVAGVYQRRGLHITRKHASSNLELSDYLFTHLQQLHRVGAPTGVVHVALGDDHPVYRLDVAPLQKCFYGTLVDVARGQVGGVELDAVHAAHQ